MSRFPRSWSARLEGARRDLRMLVNTVRGVKPSPVIKVSGGAAGGGGAGGGAGASRAVGGDPLLRATLQATRTLRVVEIIRETADAATLVLEDPAGRVIEFQPGQFFTLVFVLDGQEYRRAYSICSGPEASTRVAVTCKRMPEGKVSGFINRDLRVGDAVRVLGPSGNFLLAPAPGGRPRHVLFVAGGSGITPFMALTRWVLAREPHTKVTLVYGNRSDRDVIFGVELRRLAAAHPDQLTLIEVQSDPAAGWTGHRGLLDQPTCEAVLASLPGPAPEAYYLCGPEPMMKAARAALELRGVAAGAIHEEKFSQPHLRAGWQKSEAARVPHPVTYRIKGVQRSLEVPADQSLLDAGLAAGVPMEFSCAMGGCGACRVKLVDGAVEMEEPNCLTEEERRGGYVLACVSHPTCAATVEAA